MAQDLTLLEYNSVSTCNRTVSQVRLGDILKGGNRRKPEEKVWEDRDRQRYVPHEVEMYGGGGLERQTE